MERLTGRPEPASSATMPNEETTIVLTDVARALSKVTDQKTSVLKARTPIQSVSPHLDLPPPVERQDGAEIMAQLASAIIDPASKTMRDHRAQSALSEDASPASQASVSTPSLVPIKTTAESMPLLLTARSSPAGQTPTPPPDRNSPTQYAAHALLGIALLAICLLMTAPVPEIARYIGINLQNDERQPRLARITEPVSLDFAQNLLPEVPDAYTPVLLPEDQSLLETCEALITRGEIKNAREKLTEAASNGRTVARFALAETFDPNVLAAWGLRTNVADASVALVIYRQALDAVDRRASVRIEALESEAAATVASR